MKKHFTLIEVLVAMTVFIVGVSPLLGVLTSLTVNHVGFMNEHKVNSFLKYKATEIMNTNEEWSDSVNTEVEIRGIAYSLYIRDVKEGVQQIQLIAGSATSLYKTAIKVNFKDPRIEEDDRIQARLSFTHTYPIEAR